MREVKFRTIGWGRDYGDVSPVTGFIVGGGKHDIQVAVDVAPVIEVGDGVKSNVPLANPL